MSSVHEFLASHPVFTREEFASKRAGRSSDPRAIDSLLAYHVGRGSILRLRRGLFAAVPAGSTPEETDPDSMLVAARLAPDAVLAYHTALEFHGVANSAHRTLTVLSRARVRTLRFRGRTIRALRPPHAEPPEAALSVGVVTAARSGCPIRVTSRERTMIDCLDRPEIAGGWEEVWASLLNLPPLDISALREYLEFLDNKTTSAKLGWFLTRNRDAFPVEERLIDDLRARAPRSPVTVDRRSGSRGSLIDGWNLVIPTRLRSALEQLHAG